MSVKELLKQVNYLHTNRVIVINENGTQKYDDLRKHYDSKVVEFIEAITFENEDIIKVVI